MQHVSKLPAVTEIVENGLQGCEISPESATSGDFFL